MLTFADIKNAKDYELTTVNVPEWGGDVLLRPLTSDAKDQYELAMLGVSESNTGRIRALLVALCLVDAQGKRIVSDDEIEALGDKSGKVLDRLYQEARKINGLNGDEIDEAKKN